ncbi:MAG TPA: HPF/RaiA family ribosome-associated protein [Thiopseudomonas sp.]|nr:HPF/RaiA family ribosome-associated protein [Thiopseudomonas sp.]
MQIPLEVTFRNAERSEPIEEAIRDRVDKLNRYFEHIISCRVIVEVPNRTPQYDVLNHRVSVDISVPGEELVVSREPNKNDNFNDIYVTIRDAFDAAEQQLRGYAGRIQETRVLPTDEKPTAVVEKMFMDKGYGFLLTTDGREIYFHENSVSPPGFDRLNIGDTVRFVESRGDEGPQASLVKSLARG